MGGYVIEAIPRALTAGSVDTWWIQILARPAGYEPTVALRTGSVVAARGVGFAAGADRLN